MGVYIVVSDPYNHEFYPRKKVDLAISLLYDGLVTKHDLMPL